jgi:ABC-type multidrug transport system fused ATPase/permease subunit
MKAFIFNSVFGTLISEETHLKTLLRVWRHLSPRRHTQFMVLLALMILASFAEIMSIGAVLPFLAILTDPGRVFMHPNTQTLVQALSIKEPQQLLLPLTIAFGVAALIAALMRMLLLWVSTRLSFAAGADLSIKIYRSTLYQPYSVYLARNSSEIIDGISVKTNSAIYLIQMALNLISSVVMLASILFALLYVDPLVALTTFGGFGFIYLVVMRLTRKRLLINSQTVARESIIVIKSLQEGLGGMRDVLINGSQAAYCQIYSNADQPLRRAQGNNAFINYGPRYAMEAMGMLLIAALAYALAKNEDGISKAIPILGALALGAQRLLPVLQQAYGSWASIQGGLASLQDTLELLDQPLPAYVDQPPAKPLAFQRQILLKHISFRYSTKTPWVLKDLSLSIPKGSRIGFIGTTGSGKSTLLDIVMGLLHPTQGTLEIDEQFVTPANYRNWQAHIAHVPQAIYLADSTIEENIAFGIPKDHIDAQRVQQAAQQAQIAEAIENWPDQYQTFVGERGVRLSGGQRQRIGIARALYRQADVIIFDEATSALDSETELSVMQAIEGLSKDLTLLIIAHRITTLTNCTHIVELVEGGIKRVGSYKDIVNKVV